LGTVLLVVNEKNEKSESEMAVTSGGNSGIRLGSAKIFVSEEEYVYVTGSCERELHAVKQIGGIAELPKPKCVLEIYFMILLLSNNTS
jgi:hypothetical protein